MIKSFRSYDDIVFTEDGFSAGAGAWAKLRDHL